MGMKGGDAHAHRLERRYFRRSVSGTVQTQQEV